MWHGFFNQKKLRTFGPNFGCFFLRFFCEIIYVVLKTSWSSMWHSFFNHKKLRTFGLNFGCFFLALFCEIIYQHAFFQTPPGAWKSASWKCLQANETASKWLNVLEGSLNCLKEPPGASDESLESGLNRPKSLEGTFRRLKPPQNAWNRLR